MLLSFHAWYKSKKELNWNELSYGIILSSVRAMLSLLKTRLPRKEGHGWKIQKFHELLHVPIDVKNFGSPKMFDTGIVENRLIHVGKINVLSAQKRGTKVFTRQVGPRIHEKQCFDKAWRCNKHLLPTDEHGSVTSDDTNSNSSMSTISFNIANVLTIDAKYLLRKSPDCIIQQYHNKCCQTSAGKGGIIVSGMLVYFLVPLVNTLTIPLAK